MSDQHLCADSLSTAEFVYANDTHGDETEFTVKVEHVCGMSGTVHTEPHRCIRWKCDKQWAVSNHE